MHRYVIVCKIYHKTAWLSRSNTYGQPYCHHHHYNMHHQNASNIHQSSSNTEVLVVGHVLGAALAGIVAVASVITYRYNALEASHTLAGIDAVASVIAYSYITPSEPPTSSQALLPLQVLLPIVISPAKPAKAWWEVRKRTRGLVLTETVDAEPAD